MIGVNGYAFVVTNNGYILTHPDLRPVIPARDKTTNMVECSWREGFHCATGTLGKGDQTCESFRRSCIGGVSPLYWRLPILIWALATLIWSMMFFWGTMDKFFLYMTHWGLLFIVLEAAFGVVVSTRRGDLSDATFGLPWFVKTYWVLYNITIPVSFLITVFYWSLLKTSTKEASTRARYAPNPVLDVMLHGVNSAVMLVELVSSAHPSRLMHIMQPLYFAGAYMLFTVIYYFSGGLDPWGNPFIYPVVDWSKPEHTLVVITVTALFLALMHLLVVAIAAARDSLARMRLAEPTGIYNDAFTP